MMAAVRSVVLGLVVLLSAACAPGAPAQPPPAPRDRFAIDADALLRENPHAARKIARSPLAYFRYTNRLFVDALCDRYATSIRSMPTVLAHGDAHIEQYAVAADGRGLADFDAAALGPPIVDLARFATSLVLAYPSDERGARSAIEALLKGYERALDDPSAQAPEPAVAARLRSRFAPSATAWLDKVEKLIVPVPKEEQPKYDASWAAVLAQLRASDASLGEDYFKIKASGRLDLGIGSTRVDKYIARLEGPTPAPEDDIFLEAKGLGAGALGTCMRGSDADATRVVTAQAHYSSTPEKFLAAVTIDGKPFYSHAWRMQYTELSASDIRSAGELAELSEEVGIQLGRGHAMPADTTKAEDQRRALKTALVSIRPGLADTAVDLAAQVTLAWKNYLSASHQVAWTRHPKP
jgi:uncharacterized protein (DUF2252 family)